MKTLPNILPWIWYGGSLAGLYTWLYLYAHPLTFYCFVTIGAVCLWVYVSARICIWCWGEDEGGTEE